MFLYHLNIIFLHVLGTAYNSLKDPRSPQDPSLKATKKSVNKQHVCILINHKGATVQHYTVQCFITHPLPSALNFHYENIDTYLWSCYLFTISHYKYTQKKQQWKVFLSLYAAPGSSVVCSILFHQRSPCRNHHNELCRGRQRRQHIHRWGLMAL